MLASTGARTGLQNGGSAGGFKELQQVKRREADDVVAKNVQVLDSVNEHVQDVRAVTCKDHVVLCLKSWIRRLDARA